MTKSAVSSFFRVAGTSSSLMKQLPSGRPQQVRQPRQGLMWSQDIFCFVVARFEHSVDKSLGRNQRSALFIFGTCDHDKNFFCHETIPAFSDKLKKKGGFCFRWFLVFLFTFLLHFFPLQIFKTFYSLSEHGRISVRSLERLLFFFPEPCVPKFGGPS